MADINGLNVNRLLKITLRTASSPSCTLGTLTIHLHHTSRLIQIQGGFMMPDSTMGPIWFAENLLLPMFKERGVASIPHIQNINSAILSLKTTKPQPNQRPLPDNPSKKCGGCLKTFSNNACPMPCTTCAKFFHKTSCWKSHRCGDSTSQGVSLITSAPSSFLALPPLTQRSLPVKRSAANITCFEIDSDDDDDIPTPLIVDSQPTFSLLPGLLSYTTSMAAPPCLPPPLLEFSSSPAPGTTTASNLVPASQPPPKKQKKNSVPVSKDAIDNELLRRELNAASAKITSLERELKTSMETCSILSERIKYFEDKETQQIHDKYFSQEQPSSGHTQSDSTDLPSPPPAGSCSSPSPTPSSSLLGSPTTTPPERAPPPPPSGPSTAQDRADASACPPSSASPPPTSPPVPTSTSGPTVNINTTRPSVPMPSGHCHCTLELAIMRNQIESINHQLSALTNASNPVPPPPSEPMNTSSNVLPDPATTVHNDGQPEAPEDAISSENRNSQASQTEPPPHPRTRQTKPRVQLNTPPAQAPPPTSRPPVWLPGRAPASLSQPSCWPPRSARSRQSTRTRRAPVPVSDLIDLN